MIKLAFYKAEKGRWDDKIIDLFTGQLGYSHVAFVEKDNTILESYQSKGVTRTYTNLDDDCWDIVEVPNFDYFKVENKLLSQLGNQYDWVGLIINWLIPIQFFFRDDLDPQRKWWCSEYIAWGLGLEDNNISPNTLFKIIIEEYGQ